MNVLFTASNKIGFVKLSESTVASIMCDAGPYQITTAILDSMTTSIIYAATTTGEILVFESFNSLLKPESLECKLLGKTSTQIGNAYKQGLIKTNSSDWLFDLKSLKGSILAYGKNGVFEIHNVSSTPQHFIENERAPVTYRPSSFSN